MVLLNNFKRNPCYNTSDYLTNHLTFKENSFICVIEHLIVVHGTRKGCNNVALLWFTTPENTVTLPQTNPGLWQ